MTIFFKLAVIATAALATMVSAAPVDSTTASTTTSAATITSAAATTSTATTTTAAAATFTSTSTRLTSANMLSVEDQNVIVFQGTSSPYSGRGTWFTDSVGSCGTPFTTEDMIVAMNADQMGGTSQCGKTVKIRSGGKTVTARVTDTCPAEFCKPGSLDLSQAVFKQLAPLSQGVVSIEWEFV